MSSIKRTTSSCSSWMEMWRIRPTLMAALQKLFKIYHAMRLVPLRPPRRIPFAWYFCAGRGNIKSHQRRFSAPLRRAPKRGSSLLSFPTTWLCIAALNAGPMRRRVFASSLAIAGSISEWQIMKSVRTTCATLGPSWLSLSMRPGDAMRNSAQLCHPKGELCEDRLRNLSLKTQPSPLCVVPKK